MFSLHTLFEASFRFLDFILHIFFINLLNKKNLKRPEQRCFPFFLLLIFETVHAQVATLWDCSVNL